MKSNENILSCNSDKGHYDWNAIILSMKEAQREILEEAIRRIYVDSDACSVLELLKEELK